MAATLVIPHGSGKRTPAPPGPARAGLIRTTARFTLHVVHALQNLFAQVRTFAFVDDVVEITDLFDEHPLEQVLGLVFGGDVVDVDATSDYGTVFAKLAAEHSGAFTPTLDPPRPGRRAGQRQRAPPRRLRRPSPAGAADDRADPRAAPFLGPRRMRPACPHTRSTALAWRSSATCPRLTAGPATS